MLTGKGEEVLVSVIIPAFNAEKFVLNAVHSILIQTHYNLEILLLNDGSTDGTLNIFKTFNDKRIRIINSINNTRKVGLVNDVLKQVKGKYVLFQDADDSSSEKRIEMLVQFLESNENVGLCFSGYSLNNNFLDDTWRVNHNQLINEFIDEKDGINYFAKTVYATGMFRSSLLEKVHGYAIRMQGRIGEDIEFFYSLCQFTKAHTLAKVLYNYNVNRVGSLTELNGLNLRIPNYDLNLVKASIKHHYHNGINPIREYNDHEFLLFEFELMKNHIDLTKTNVIEVELKYQSSTYYKLGKFLLYPLSFLVNLFRKCFAK